jgi:hypothetical protein
MSHVQLQPTLLDVEGEARNRNNDDDDDDDDQNLTVPESCVSVIC